ncbi:MAG TPA: hypothetical protein VFI08_12895 [Spirochaetia bacterium]|nr:hypothetical protein [Spirochaetia bacterium]
MKATAGTPARRAALAAACLALAGCAPPYLVELDKAAGVVSQMTLVGTVGPVSVDPSATNVRFLPARPTASSIGSVSVPGGFLVSDSSNLENLAFVTSGGQQNGSDDFSLAGALSNYPLYQYDVTNTLSNTASVVVSKLDGLSSDTYQQFTVSLPSGSLTQVGSALPFTGLFSTAPTTMGLSDVPTPSSTRDTFAFLVFLAGNFSIGTAQMDGSANVFPLSGSAFSTGNTIPGPTRSLYYFSAASGASVASYYAGGQWACQQWFGTGASTVMTGVTHRIDAVLGTGDYLSTEGGTLRLYDSSGTGKEVLSMDLKGLQFCYEAYVGSDPYVFFALGSTVRHGQMAFSVYAIPSSAMRGLHS